MRNKLAEKSAAGLVGLRPRLPLLIGAVLITAALITALIASAASSKVIATVQGEAMVAAAGTTASTTKVGKSVVLVLKRGGGVSAAFNLPSATQQMTLRAANEGCSGGLVASVAIDGKQVLNKSISKTSLSNVTASVDLVAGNHTLAISYPNDQAGSCDVSLYIDQTTFITTRTTSTAPSSVPSPSPTVATGSPTAITCDLTQKPSESVAAFLTRLGTNQEGCLLAGTYDLGGNLKNFKAGQKLHPAPAADGTRYQKVVLRGTLTLNVSNLQIHDLFIGGVQNSENSKIIEVMACDNCVLDHLDITSEPQYVAFQGILNNTPTTGLQITNNKIHHVGGDGQLDHGIYCKTPMNSGVIRGNWIYANAAYGIQFYPNCDAVDFSYNVVDDNGALANPNTISSACGDNPPCPKSDTNGRGVAFAGQDPERSDNVTVHNVIISTFGTPGRSAIHCTQAGSANSLQASLVYQPDTGTQPLNDCGSSIGVSGLVSADPLYVNRINRDYRLQANSPARALMGGYADAVPGPRI